MYTVYVCILYVYIFGEERKGDTCIEREIPPGRREMIDAKKEKVLDFEVNDNRGC
jgi:hypothetical protein